MSIQFQMQQRRNLPITRYANRNNLCKSLHWLATIPHRNLRIFRDGQLQPCQPTSWSKFNIEKATDDEDLCDQKLYQFIIGLLMYAARATRPDIAYATHFLGQFSLNPTETHLSATKRVLQLLKKTIMKTLTYKYNTNELPLRIYSDTSFAFNLTDRHSYTGLVIQTSGQTTICRSKKQKTVSHSTTVAEYLAFA